MLYLFAYDIQDDKTRTRAMKLLKNHGYHVQKSLFIIECESQQEASKIFVALSLSIEEETDRLFCVPLCNHCLSRKMRWGNDPDFEQNVWIF